MGKKLSWFGFILSAFLATVSGCSGGGSGDSPVVSSTSSSGARTSVSTTIDAVPVKIKPVAPIKRAVKAAPDTSQLRHDVKVEPDAASSAVVTASSTSAAVDIINTAAGTVPFSATSSDQAGIIINAGANETVLVYVDNALLQAISSNGTSTIFKAGPGRYKMIIAANDGSFVSSIVDKNDNNVFEISRDGLLVMVGKVETRPGRIAYDIIGKGFTRIFESPVFMAVPATTTESCSGNWVGASGITGGNNPNYPVGTEYRLCWNISQTPGDFQLTNIDPSLGAVKGTANGNLVLFWFVGKDLAGTNTIYRETMIVTSTRPCNGWNWGVFMNGNDHQTWPPSHYLDAVVNATADRDSCTR